jgi:steroid 5-alpha reductase family enzyme
MPPTLAMTLAHLRAFAQLGSNISVAECVLAYLLPLGYYLFCDAVELKELFIWNAICQICIFVVIVQIPLAMTQKMAYVDIGWPLGLCVLGMNGLFFGTGMKLRRYLVCGCMILHGGRMFLGM